MLTSRSNGGTVGDVGAVEQDPARGRQLEARDHAQGRGLARARRPEHREELAVADLEVDAGDRDDVAVVLGDQFEADRGRHGRTVGRGAGGLDRDRQAGTSKLGPDGRRAVVGSGRRTVPRSRRRVKQRRTASRSARHRLRAVSPHAAVRAASPHPAVRRASALRAGLIGIALVIAAACEAGPPPPTPPIVPGASGSPREVNLIAKDYSFLPDALDLAPGETVLLHVINGGLEVHEAVIGDAARPGRLGGRRGGDRRRPARPDPGRERAARRRRPPDRRPLRGARGCRLDGPGRDAGRAPGRSAATSPATGHAGCASRSAGSATSRPRERAGWYALAQRRGARDR